MRYQKKLHARNEQVAKMSQSANRRREGDIKKILGRRDKKILGDHGERRDEKKAAPSEPSRWREKSLTADSTEKIRGAVR